MNQKSFIGGVFLGIAVIALVAVAPGTVFGDTSPNLLHSLQQADHDVSSALTMGRATLPPGVVASASQLLNVLEQTITLMGGLPQAGAVGCGASPTVLGTLQSSASCIQAALANVSNSLPRNIVTETNDLLAVLAQAIQSIGVSPAGRSIRPSFQSIAKTVSGPNSIQYEVVYAYREDGEVRATFTYNSKAYAMQNYNTFGTAGGIALVQSDGSFGKPYTGQADLTLLSLANQIATNAPLNTVVFPGFTFATPLYYVDDVSPFYVDTPADAVSISASPFAGIATPGLYRLTQDANGNLVNVIPVNVSLAGVMTNGAAIILQAKSSAQSVLGGSSPSGYLNSLISGLQGAGFQISENTAALGQVIGIASKNGQPALYFRLGDQIVSGVPANSNGSCILQAPDGGAPIPIEVEPDGTISHLSHDFNVVVDPSALSAIDWGNLSNTEIQSDLIQAFLKGYDPYTQVGGLPKPTEQPNADAIVIIGFANIPSVEYTYFNGSGEQVTQQINEAANTVTLFPGSAGFNYVPSGSAQTVITALNAGKQVVIVIYNSQYFGNIASTGALEFYGVTEHEMGHPLGLNDDYENGASPMRASDLAADGPITISPRIYNYLFDIQQSKTFTTVKCGTSQTLTSPSAGPHAGYVPIATNGGTDPRDIVWVIQGSCTDEQLADGYTNFPLAAGGCYLPTPTSSVALSFGAFPDQISETETCVDNFGNDYACASKDCGGAGQFACPVNVPKGTCLDGVGDPTACPGTDGFSPPESGPNGMEGITCVTLNPDCPDEAGNDGVTDVNGSCIAPMPDCSSDNSANSGN